MPKIRFYAIIKHGYVGYAAERLCAGTEVQIMIHTLSLIMNTVAQRSLLAENIPWGILITELAIAFVLLVFLFLLRRRFLKIICICGAEICLFLACKLAFGPDAIITQIMCWFTAAVACIMTVSIVNRINWSNLRGKQQK